METPRMMFSDNENIAHIHMMKGYSALKKNGIMKFAGKYMGLENIVWDEAIQTKKDKCCVFLLICGS